MLDKIYKTIFSIFEANNTVSLSAVTSSSERSMNTPSKLSSAEEMAQEHWAAQELICMFPKSAEGYLASGYLHEQQDDFRTALMVYNQGLQSVPQPQLSCNNTWSHYIRLEKAKRNALNMLMEHIEGFRRILPYDILSLIFEDLELYDLLQCAGVCRSWFDFMLDWPVFWQRLRIEIPKTSRSTLEPLLRRQTQEFRLDGPVTPDSVNGLLLLLAEQPSQDTDNNSVRVRKLVFTSIHLTHIGIALLQRTLRSIGPGLKHVEFINCSFQDSQLLEFISKSCSEATHVSFSQSMVTNPSGAISTTLYDSKSSKLDNNRTALSYFSRKTKRMVVIPFTFDFLTHLEISGNFYYFEPLQQTSRLLEILCQCPNLMDLILSPGVSIHHTHCISQALKYCPRLRNLTVCNKTELKPTIATDEYSSSTGDVSSSAPKYDTDNVGIQQVQPSNADSLRWLILGSQSFEFSNLPILPILLERSHRTLEFLYLRCNLNRKLFMDLVSYGGPQLREINLSMVIKGGTQQQHKNALITLFSRCPVLEVVTIDNCESGRVYCSSRFHSLVVDNDILFAIAKSCPLLRRLHVTGSHSHSILGLSGFASTRLAYLEIEIVYQSYLLGIVQKLTSLKTLHTVYSSSRTWPEGYGIPSDHLERLKKILGERGGDLILDLH
ncbi:hypothetical protein BDB00DRAFT_808471 [Zychaea mexicana]|uniref:uncharacterized protein n=1 Tax=Zychaea mexicana TaxID=64656 RepID=UPI0022FE07EA|nr:uncharacterized protein BDB00DRAFT_808471 [Zychaea mexicana]KAI9496721.1 hypothetical protein BDB00DRAFT_808471 [Zychaea mexicana]